MSNLKALLRALVLVVLLGTGLWLMDQIAQTTMAVRSRGTGPKTAAGVPTQTPGQQSAPPEGYAPHPQEPSGQTADAARPSSPAPADASQVSKAGEPGEQPLTTPATTPPSPPESRPQEAGSVRMQRRGDTQYIVTEPILFNTASSVIREISIQPLKKVAALLAERREVKLMIIGYTDNLGMPENNQRVSAERAAAVKEFLVSQGVDPARLDSKGLGSQNPIASNDTQMGRQANRRIEFIVAGVK